MNTRSSVMLPVVVLGLVFALTSCSYLHFTWSRPDQGCPATGAGMCVTLETIGGATLKGMIFVPRPGTDPAASCATWVQGEGGSPGRITLPGAFDKTVGGHTVRFGSNIVGYTGPGSYQGDDAIRSANDSSLSITVDTTRYSGYRALDRETAEVRPDGSGEVTFLNLVQAVTANGQARKQINGRYTWTCQD